MISQTSRRAAVVGAVAVTIAAAVVAPHSLIDDMRLPHRCDS
jgi:hypothetical protein